LRCRGIKVHGKPARICVLPRIGQINDAIVINIHSIAIFHRPREIRNWRCGIQMAPHLERLEGESWNRIPRSAVTLFDITSGWFRYTYQLSEAHTQTHLASPSTIKASTKSFAAVEF
jgi:hypothetical protein